MTRATIWSGVALIAVLAAGLLWFASAFEPVAVRRRDAPQAEAQRDPYLALDRFLSRMGRPPRRSEDAQALDHLDAQDGPRALVLDRRRAYQMTPARVERLWAWVERGGYLIVVPEAAAVPDPIVAGLGLERVATDSGFDASAHPPAQYAVRIPGAPRPLAIAARGGFISSEVPAWSAGDPAFGFQVAHFSRGLGAVTVVEGLDALVSNGLVGELDHAELLWRLIERYQPTGPVLLLSRLETLSLFGWLAANARAALVAGAVALLLWLWQVVPRFGSVLPDAPADRRELREHLRAVGRFVWTRGGAAAWLPVIRGAVLERIGSRWPALPPGGDVRVLADHTGLTPADVDRALHAQPHDADAFVATARALQQLDRRL